VAERSIFPKRRAQIRAGGRRTGTESRRYRGRDPLGSTKGRVGGAGVGPEMGPGVPNLGWMLKSAEAVDFKRQSAETKRRRGFAFNHGDFSLHRLAAVRSRALERASSPCCTGFSSPLTACQLSSVSSAARSLCRSPSPNFGRPRCLPAARARSRPAFVGWLIFSRSSLASEARVATRCCGRVRCRLTGAPW
jgi:hypothetical protein